MTRLGESVVRGRLRGTSAPGCRGSCSQNIWQRVPRLKPSPGIAGELRNQPPLGVAGIEATDKAKERSGKLIFGALGIGALKLKLHRACIGQLFERSDQVLDAEQIYALAKAMA